MTGFRLATGGHVERTRPLRFRFDGGARTGLAGDTLASALLADGQRLLGRSFKYHRPRGVMTAGPEEPCALVELRDGARREPNTPATTVELFDGLQASSQNRWPSLRFDALAAAGLAAPLLAAGFYYKTFKWPRAAWERLYEPAIRRAAGLGRGATEADPDAYEHLHAHCDLLVAGAGAAGLMAARLAHEGGARVLLLEQDFAAGGGLLQEPAWEDWRAAMLAALPPGVLVTRCTLVGAYGQGVYAAVEKVADHLPQPGPHQPRQRLHIIRARHALLATGATERMIAFPGNDRPGVMLAGAARTYARRFGVGVARRVAMFTTDDAGHDAARDLAALGIEVAAVIDPRAEPPASALRVLAGHEVCGTEGALHGVRLRRVGGAASEVIAADALLVCGGLSMASPLASQAGLAMRWDAALQSFIPGEAAEIRCAGAARGLRGIAACARDGAAAIAALGLRGGALPDLPADEPPPGPTAPIREIHGRQKAFVDLQHDVTTDDLRLAHAEGYGDVEHAKRYTTHGMGTDQGRIGGLLGSAVLAAARGVALPDVGASRPRPFAVPVAWGALAGAEVGTEFKPERRLPLHDWHAAAGATFTRIGNWLRPLVYSDDTSWPPVLREARAVRGGVGLCDVSSLGKIDLRGPDAATFLDRIYCNTISTLPVGRARYGLMLREDGMVFDDGTVARLGETHFLLTATTQKAEDVLAHLEFHTATTWPELAVRITNVGDHWAQFALAGPQSRESLAPLLDGLDLSDAAFPFMAAAPATIAGVPGRLFRISFSGERAYEVAVPAHRALPVWQALVAAGAQPYALDALNVLRIEKGHVTGGEINGTTTAEDLGLGRMLKKRGDFIGRALSQRPGLRDPRRPQLVGIRPLDPAQRLRGGAHLRVAGGPSQGYVTACCMAAEGEGWLGLALLAGGHARHGETLLADSPVHDHSVAVRIGSPHAVDPENLRVRG